MDLEQELINLKSLIRIPIRTILRRFNFDNLNTSRVVSFKSFQTQNTAYKGIEYTFPSNPKFFADTLYPYSGW
jgi:hypothetical protein